MISESTLRQFNRDFLLLITSKYAKNKIILIDSSLEEKGGVLSKNYKNTIIFNSDRINFYISFFKERFISFKPIFKTDSSSQTLIYDGLEVSFNHRIITFKNGKIIEKPTVKPKPDSTDYEYYETMTDFANASERFGYRNWVHPRWAWLLKDLIKKIEESFKLRWPESALLWRLKPFTSCPKALPAIIRPTFYKYEGSNLLELPPKVSAEIIRRKDCPFQFEEFDYEKYKKRLGFPGKLIFNQVDLENYELMRKRVYLKKSNEPQEKRAFLDELACFPVKPEFFSSAREFLDKCQAEDIFIDPELPEVIEEIENSLLLRWPESFRQLGTLNYLELFSEAKAIILKQRPLWAAAEAEESETKKVKGKLSQAIFAKTQLLPAGTGLPGYTRLCAETVKKKENKLDQQFRRLINSLYYQNYFLRIKPLQPDDFVLKPMEFLVGIPSIIIREKSLERAFIKAPDLVEQIIFDILEGDVLRTTSGFLVSACCSRFKEAVGFLEIIGLRHLRDFFKFDEKKEETYKSLIKSPFIAYSHLFRRGYFPDSIFFDYVDYWDDIAIYNLEPIAKKFKLFQEKKAFVLKLKTGIEEILDDDEKFHQFIILEIKK